MKQGFFFPSERAMLCESKTIVSLIKKTQDQNLSPIYTCRFPRPHFRLPRIKTEPNSLSPFFPSLCCLSFTFVFPMSPFPHPHHFPSPLPCPSSPPSTQSSPRIHLRLCLRLIQPLLPLLSLSLPSTAHAPGHPPNLRITPRPTRHRSLALRINCHTTRRRTRWRRRYITPSPYSTYTTASRVTR